MTLPYTHLADLLTQVEITDDTTVSRTIHSDDHLKAVLFGFAAGQELSEHTAARPAVIHILQGQAALTLGENAVDAGPGTWIHMPAGLPHSVRALTPLVMLLLLIRA